MARLLLFRRPVGLVGWLLRIDGFAAISELRRVGRIGEGRLISALRAGAATASAASPSAALGDRTRRQVAAGSGSTTLLTGCLVRGGRRTVDDFALLNRR